MATDALEIADIPDSAVNNDEISVLDATPGTSKLNSISVEDYPRTDKTVIDLSQDSSYFDDEVKLLDSVPETPKKFFKGECSDPKTSNKTQPSFPLSFTCEICAVEKPVSDAFRVLGCNHSYCTVCTGKYVASKLSENISNINCPVSDCQGFFEPEHCRFILPKQVFDRWGDALCEAFIMGWERYYCPYKDCSALLIDDGSGENEVIVQSECPYCKRLFCVQCNVPWHSSLACADFQKLNEDERTNEDIMLMNLAQNSNWMRCPKCKFYVSRSEGCLLMKCRCGHTFCYNCGAPLTDHYCQNCKH